MLPRSITAVQPLRQLEKLLEGDLTDSAKKKRTREWLSKTYNTLGISHDLRGEHGHAAVAYQRALEASPGSRYAHSCGPSLQQPRVQLRGHRAVCQSSRGQSQGQ